MTGTLREVSGDGAVVDKPDHDGGKVSVTACVGTVMTRVHVLHENPEWFPPLAAAFDAESVPYTEWLLDGDGALDLDGEPPEGIFWSRASASSHTRGHPFAKDHTRAVLRWLEGHGRRVVGGSGVLELEMSKVAQHAALAAAGLDTPRTVAVVGRQGLAARARRLPVPFVAKHNQGGKGLGVRRFDSYAAFDRYVSGPDFERPVDGITLLQEYVEPAEPFITRVEIVGGRFLYALAASTTNGFQLCPADACAVDGSCPADGGGLFELRKDYEPPLLPAYLDFAARHGIEIAAFEYIQTAEGRLVTYDVNTNTNYNPAVEAQADRSGPVEIARYLRTLLEA